MTHAYSEMYLEDAMRTLGDAADFALCDQGLNPAELTAILSNAFEMNSSSTVYLASSAACRATSSRAILSPMRD